MRLTVRDVATEETIVELDGILTSDSVMDVKARVVAAALDPWRQRLEAQETFGMVGGTRSYAWRLVFRGEQKCFPRRRTSTIRCWGLGSHFNF